MTEAAELTASIREVSGKGASRTIRRDGKIPGIIYGGTEPPLSVTLPHKEVDLRIQRGGFLTTVINLDIDGKPLRVIPREYQLDPVKDSPLHVDFLRITADSVVTVEIPVQFINEEESPGLKRGGVINVVRHAVEVTCPAEQIPDHFTADLAGLDINDSVHISAIALPDRVVPTITDRDFTIATIAAPAGLTDDDEEAEEAEEGAAEGEDGEEAETADGEGKSDEASD